MIFPPFVGFAFLPLLIVGEIAAFQIFYSRDPVNLLL